MFMSKIKVCILQNGLARGGTDTFVVNLCRGIDKERFELTIVNPATSEHCLVREPEIIAEGWEIVRTSPLNGLWSKLKHFWKLFWILKKGKFDVFHTNVDLFNGPQLFIAWLAGVPMRICHSHNTNQQKALVQGNTMSVRIYQGLMRWMCWTFSNRRIGCSEMAMDFLFKGKDWKQNLYPIVINNGIDISLYRKKIDVEGKKQELGITAKYNITAVGKIAPQKNPIFIAKSFVELCKLRDDCDLVWVGDGNLRTECEEIFMQNGVQNRVHFFGQRSDVNEILQCCNLFFMPSSFEGLGIVIIEAQAAGLPCLVSTEVPQEANCGGCFYKSLNDSKADWASAMSDLLDKKIELKVKETDMQKFSINYMVEQMQQVFKS